MTRTVLEVATTVILTLPEPPSANRYWRYVVVRGRPTVLVSSEAKAYRRAVAEQWVGTHAVCGKRAEPLTGPVSVLLTWYRGRRSGDLDNRIKQVLDALKGLAFDDDSQVVYLSALREDDKDNARIEVTVKNFSR